MLYTLGDHLEAVPVIASFSRDGKVIPLYVELEGKPIKVSCRSSQRSIEYSSFQCDYMREDDDLVHTFELLFLHDKLLWGFKRK